MTRIFQGKRLDLFYPFFLTLQFAFFVGWLKVAETLINPFGEDDDDFELNRLIDRHIQVGFLICDPLVTKPELMRDRFWSTSIPAQMPYTKAAEAFKKEEYKGSAEVYLKVKESDRIYSDTSVNGDNIRFKQSEESDDNYETIPEGFRLKKLKRRVKRSKNEKKPPLPEKNTPNIVISGTLDLNELYSTSTKKHSLISIGYNEDDEDFEEINHPDDNK